MSSFFSYLTSEWEERNREREREYKRRASFSSKAMQSLWLAVNVCSKKIRFPISNL